MQLLMKKIIVFCLALVMLGVVAVELDAQYYDIGTDRASIKWNRMKSKNFEVIYPRGSEHFKKMAATYLAGMESRYGIYADSVKFNYGVPKRFPLVLHPYSAAANGITVWAPRQIDFYTLPGLDALSSEPWDAALINHEGRHAWQIAHFNKGIWKGLYYLFGDQAVGAASGIYPSIWMLEGDAVVAETQMSNGGRGRSAAFLEGIMKCIVPEDATAEELKNYSYGKNRSWDRWRFGSVKAYSPSAYHTGYLINSMARLNSAKGGITHQILNREARQPLNFNAVSSSFRKYSGKSHKEYLSSESLAQFKEMNESDEIEEFLEEAAEKHPGGARSEFMITNPLRRTGERQGYFAEYEGAVEVGKDSLAAVLEGNGTIPLAVLITKNSEGWKVEHLIHFYEGCSTFIYYDGKIWWSESNTDKRWELEGTNWIYNYDIKNRVAGEADAGPDCTDYMHYPVVMNFEGAEALYAIGYKPEYGASKSVIVPMMFLNKNNHRDGNSLDIRDLPKYEFDGQVTSFAQVGNHLYYTIIRENGLSLERIAFAANAAKKESIMPATGAMIKELRSNGKDAFLYFATDKFGGMKACKLDTRALSSEGVTSSSYPIYFASYSPDIEGFALSEDSSSIYIVKPVGDKGAFPFKESLAEVKAEKSMEFGYPLAQMLTEQYKESLEQSNVPRHTKELGLQRVEKQFSFAEERYSKAAHLFKIHSWAPAYIEVTGESSGDYDEFYEEVKPGVTLFSQNTLGTARTMFGYSYQRMGNDMIAKRKNLHAAHASFTYTGWYPVVEASAHFNDEYMFDNNFSFRSDITTYIPIRYYDFGYDRGITPLLSWSYKNSHEVLEPLLDHYKLKNVSWNGFTAGISAFKVLYEEAPAQLFPRWGFGGSLLGSYNLIKGKDAGSTYSASAYSYFPGLRFNQGLRLSAAYQHQKAVEGDFLPENHLSMPRGFTEDMVSKNYFRATADYAIPIYLGDISLGPIAYLQQLQVVPFADFGRFQMETFTPIPYIVLGGTPIISNGISWQNRYSFGADVVLKGHFFRIGFPISVGVRYARTSHAANIGNIHPSALPKNEDRNHFSLLLGISFR